MLPSSPISPSLAPPSLMSEKSILKYKRNNGQLTQRVSDELLSNIGGQGILYLRTSGLLPTVPMAVPEVAWRHTCPASERQREGRYRRIIEQLRNMRDRGINSPTSCMATGEPRRASATERIIHHICGSHDGNESCRSCFECRRHANGCRQRRAQGLSCVTTRSVRGKATVPRTSTCAVPPADTAGTVASITDRSGR
jgi:hypothetical protein